MSKRYHFGILPSLWSFWAGANVYWNTECSTFLFKHTESKGIFPMHVSKSWLTENHLKVRPYCIDHSGLTYICSFRNVFNSHTLQLARPLHLILPTGLKRKPPYLWRTKWIHHSQFCSSGHKAPLLGICVFESKQLVTCEPLWHNPVTIFPFHPQWFPDKLSNIFYST